MTEFRSVKNVIVEGVTQQQMVEVDRVAINLTGPNLFQMMENAGRNLAEFVIQNLGKKHSDKSVIVLAGTGGNGGGGICAARHLVNHNINAKLVLSSFKGLSGVPKKQLEIYKNAGGKVISLQKAEMENASLLIDAIIGYGINGAPKGKAKKMIDWVNQSGIKVVSLDVPSGVDSTTGETAGSFVKPLATLTLALPKTGLNSKNSGKIYLVDIGIPQKTFELSGINYASPFDDKYIIKITKV